MPSPELIAAAYLNVWNESDPDRRRSLLADGWSEGARYVDPLMRSEGLEGVASMIEAARSQFPGHAFSLRGTPDGHDAYVRFSWSLAPRDGAPVFHGTDIVEVTAEGRIVDVLGFLDAA